MSELKTKVVTFFEVDYSDLEEFIKQEYGQEFNVACDQEACNDSCEEVSVNGDIREYQERNIQEFKDTGIHSYLLHALMNDLARQGKISKGEYKVDISW